MASGGFSRVDKTGGDMTYCLYRLIICARHRRGSLAVMLSQSLVGMLAARTAVDTASHAVTAGSAGD